MTVHDVDYIDLPFVSEGRYQLLSNIKDEHDDEIEDRGDCIRIIFDRDEQIGRAGQTKPRVASLDELKISFLNWMKDNKPEFLARKVEKYVHGLGHEILWTPPYAPKLQPIELFWAAGKNHVALQHHYGMKMRDVVQSLREGWYGNGNTYPVNHPLAKRLVDCRGLWRTCLNFAGTIYVKICDGITGEIGSLVVDETHTNELCDIPIDTLVLDFNRDGLEGDDFGAEEEV